MKSNCGGKMMNKGGEVMMAKGGPVKSQMPPMKGAKAIRQDKQMAMPKGSSPKGGSCKW